MPNGNQLDLGKLIGMAHKGLLKSTLQGGGNPVLGLINMASKKAVQSIPPEFKPSEFIPPEFIESARGVLKKAGKSYAEEVLNEVPNGAQLLSNIIQQSSAEAGETQKQPSQQAMLQQAEQDIANMIPEEQQMAVQERLAGLSGVGSMPIERNAQNPGPGIPDQTQPEPEPQPGQQPQENTEKKGRDTLSRLLMSLGAGLAAAGGNTSLGGQLLAMEEGKRNREAENERLSFEQSMELTKSLIEQQKEGRLQPNQIFTGFQKVSESFIDLRNSFGRMREQFITDSGELDFSGKNPAADLDLLFGTAKTLDPSGRVTDSDIAIQTLATGRFGDKLKKIAQKFTRRGFLAPDERKALYSAAQRRFQYAQRQQKQAVKEYSELAKRNGIDPKNIITDTGLNIEKPSNQSLGENKLLSTSSGTQYRRVE